MDKNTIEIDHITNVFFHERRQKHGSFLNLFMDAWFHADVNNKILLKPIALELISKYQLTRGSNA